MMEKQLCAVIIVLQACSDRGDGTKADIGVEIQIVDSLEEEYKGQS